MGYQLMCTSPDKPVDHGPGGKGNKYKWFAIDEDEHERRTEENSRWHNWFGRIMMCDKKPGGREQDDPMHDRLKKEMGKEDRSKGWGDGTIWFAPLRWVLG
jgi:hypothetical protein